MQEKENAQSGQYLTFILQGRRYGVQVSSIREINQIQDITPMPEMPEFILGVVNLRGKIVPVVDLRLKFALEKSEYTRDTCIVVIEGRDGQIGMVVDAVSEVIELSSSQIESPTALHECLDILHVQGIGKVNDQIVVLIDIVQALAKAIQANGLKEKAA